MPGSLHIAIIGGGIGGLAAALALRARGVDVAVFEQAEVLREIGAGVSIYANAARLLQRVGLENQLQKIGSPISGITLRVTGRAGHYPCGAGDACVFETWSGLQRSSRRLSECSF
jgi:salicylate hydroxylase